MTNTQSSDAAVQSVRVDNLKITVDLVDGRTIIFPVAWFPRLAHGTEYERDNWNLTDGGRGIHWPDLDERTSVENLLAGRPSSESESSLARWMACRNCGR